MRWHRLNTSLDISQIWVISGKWACVVYGRSTHEDAESTQRKDLLADYDKPPGIYRIYDSARKINISTKDWIISENEFWKFAITINESRIITINLSLLHAITTLIYETYDVGNANPTSGSYITSQNAYCTVDSTVACDRDNSPSISIASTSW